MAFWRTFLEELSWKKSLLLKSSMLSMGVVGVIWIGWPPTPNGKPGHVLSTVVVSKPQEFRSVYDVPPAADLTQEQTFKFAESNSQKRNRQGDPVGLFVNLNSSSQKELEALPGIGSVLAGRIVTYRSTNGNFRDIGELVNVSGIGMKRLQRLQPFVKVEATVETPGS